MDSSESEFTILLSVAIVVILVVGLAILLFVIFRQKKKLQTTLNQLKTEIEFQQKMLFATLGSQDKERQRLALNLHDNIGAMLSTIRLNIGALARNEDIQKEGIQEAKKMIDETIDSVRRMSQDLMPATLQKFGLLQAVKEMCDQYASQAKIKIEYQQIGGEIHLDRAKEVMLFRIVQELLNNAIRHSQGSSIQVLFNTNSPVRIEVLDDGVGFDFSEKKQNATTIGLFTMFNRARMLEATLAYDVERSIGTKATLTIPWT